MNADKTVNPRSILLVNENGRLCENFAKGLETNGFTVQKFHHQLPVYHKTLFRKVRNLIQRKLLGNEDFFVQDAQREKNRIYLSEADKINNHFDFVLMFRADRYPENVLRILRKKTDNFITYQYDGMEVCQNLLPNAALFDKIYVFDPSDLQQYRKLNFLPLTNCWFDDDSEESKLETDIFYVGVGVPERLQLIENVKNYCLNHEIILNATLTIAPYFEEKNENGVHLSHTGMKYEENIKMVRKTKAILDFKLSYHDGLSFRFFEAMKYRKKIITNNASAKYYDFYHPDNIFITDFQNLDGLKEFLEKPYHEIDAQIVQKYGFKNWMHYVLDLPPYQKIDLPQI